MSTTPPVPPGSARYFAWLFSPPECKDQVRALLAIEEEITGIARRRLEHQVAHARLEWWAGETDRMKAGSPVHPLARELHSAVGPTDLSGLVATTTWDLAHATFETRTELSAYCERWAEAMIRPLADEPSSSGAAVPLGAALRELELLVDVAREARHGRLRIPLDELDRAGVPIEAVATPPWPEPAAALLRARHQELRATLEREGQKFQQRGVSTWIALADRSSLRAERALPNSLEPRRRFVFIDTWLAWQTARRAGATPASHEDHT